MTVMEERQVMSANDEILKENEVRGGNLVTKNGKITVMPREQERLKQYQEYSMKYRMLNIIIKINGMLLRQVSEVS